MIEDPSKSVVKEIKHITRGAFRNRFTEKEKIAIEMAGIDNPTATIEKRMLAAQIRASNADVAVSQYIDLEREDTRSGVLALEKFGILSAWRALEILDNPVQDFERYKQ